MPYSRGYNRHSPPTDALLSFWLAFAETTGTGTGEQEQPFKYNGKELDREMQLSTYDHAARYMNSAIGRFSSIDPLAEKYYSWSPYHYAGNNPLRITDPTGMYWEDEESKKYAESLTKDINKKIDSKQKSLDKLNAKIEKNQAKGKDVSKDQNKSAGMQADIDNLSSGVAELKEMGNDTDQAFAFNMIEGDTGGTYFNNGTIVMDILLMAFMKRLMDMIYSREEYLQRVRDYMLQKEKHMEDSSLWEEKV